MKRIKYEFYILPSQAHSKTNYVQLGHTNTSAINPTHSSSNFPYFTPPPPPKKVIKIQTKSILFNFPTFTLSKILWGGHCVSDFNFIKNHEWTIKCLKIGKQRKMNLLLERSTNFKRKYNVITVVEKWQPKVKRKWYWECFSIRHSFISYDKWKNQDALLTSWKRWPLESLGKKVSSITKPTTYQNK